MNPPPVMKSQGGGKKKNAARTGTVVSVNTPAAARAATMDALNSLHINGPPPAPNRLGAWVCRHLVNPCDRGRDDHIGDAEDRGVKGVNGRTGQRHNLLVDDESTAWNGDRLIGASGDLNWNAIDREIANV